MKNLILLALKIVGGLVATVVVLLVAVTLLLNSSTFQETLLEYAKEELQAKLQTEVKIEHAGVNLLTQRVNLRGLEVKDQSNRKMLELGLLSVDIDLMKLLDNELQVEELTLEGVKAVLVKPADGPANYQFVIDAFKSKKPKKKVVKDSVAKKMPPLSFAIDKLLVKDISFDYNGNKIELEKIKYKNGWLDDGKGELTNLRGAMEMKTKKGPQTATFNFSRIGYEHKKTIHNLRFGDFRFTTDNHKPRKNANKPKRGFFDAGHLDLTANMDVTVDFIGEDSLNAVLTRFEARDTVTGFNIKRLSCSAGIKKDHIKLRHITLQQESTVLKFDSARVVLPSKKVGRKFSFETSRISGTTQLRDISRPFAPVLKNFKLPLKLDVIFSGNDSSLQFKDIHVYTPDKRLQIAADGRILHLKEKEKLDILYHVKQMKAEKRVAIDIINQFAVKKLMMNQLDALGTIFFTGNVRVLWKRELFDGLLRTSVGNIAFDFGLDEINKILTGHVDTKKIRLGKVLKMKDIDDVGAKAAFRVDIHKQRTAQIRKRTGGGKMPIGDVQATIYECGYKGFRLKNLKVDIQSNGKLVEGSVLHNQKVLDWDFDFSFTDIDKMSDLKVKPRMKFKLGNIFKSKEKAKADDKAKAAEKAAKDGKKKGSLWNRLFKKKKSS